MITILLLLQLADLLTTLYLLKRGGEELNPIIAYLQGFVGRDGAVVGVKVAFVVIILNVQLSLTMLVVLNLLYALVVAHNIREIWRSS